MPLEALADEPWVAPSADGVIARACQAAGFEPRLLMLSRDAMANRALVAQGLAVTLMPKLLAHEFGGIELRPVEGSGPGARPLRADCRPAAATRWSSRRCRRSPK